ncbi:MAG: putative toxin-antitoxin system toxin component, PIN family [Acidobacteriaceae bacterium]|nr:putative toxin-antitoxin system toxin component, PIN family [Acidobacteriaceae bacterium]
MRITADTGILVRSTFKANGPARELLLQIQRRGHTLVLSPFLLEQIRRVLRYERMQALYQLMEQDIENYIQFLQDSAELVTPVVRHPVVLRDPTDDPVIYTAVDGRVDVLCAMDRDFYAPEVLAFCQQRGIEIMNDVDLLQRLRETE